MNIPRSSGPSHKQTFISLVIYLTDTRTNLNVALEYDPLCSPLFDMKIYAQHFVHGIFSVSLCFCNIKDILYLSSIFPLTRIEALNHNLGKNIKEI